jgi:hypothetical protein
MVRTDLGDRRDDTVPGEVVHDEPPSQPPTIRGELDPGDGSGNQPPGVR